MLELKNTPVAVVGLGISNRALVRFLARRGALITACDQKGAEEMAGVLDELNPYTVDFSLGPDYLKQLVTKDYRYVFLTPGMKKDLPEIREAAARGAELWSEMRLFFHLCRAPIVGVTGSAGKTTTATLAARMLERGGENVYLGGNIGQPLIEMVDSIPAGAVVVLELSSFQLELLDRSPETAVLLNIRPNHLDIHGSMEAYVEAKKRILAFQEKDDNLILNLDDPESLAFATEAAGQTYFFSRREPVSRGCYIRDKWVFFKEEGRDEQVFPVAAVRLRGKHNLENALAASTVAGVMGVPPGAVATALEGFTGVEHRLESVEFINGVEFVNDSIATAPDRTLAALDVFDRPIVLIAGGYDKGIPFDQLGRAAAARVKALVLLGATADLIREAVERAAESATTAPGMNHQQAPEIHRAATLEEAVRKAKDITVPGDVVLFSPACASYDMFRNFEERGRKFKEVVGSMASEASRRQEAWS